MFYIDFSGYICSAFLLGFYDAILINCRNLFLATGKSDTLFRILPSQLANSLQLSLRPKPFLLALLDCFRRIPDLIAIIIFAFLSPDLGKAEEKADDKAEEKAAPQTAETGNVPATITAEAETVIAAANANNRVIANAANAARPAAAGTIRVADAGAAAEDIEDAPVARASSNGEIDDQEVPLANQAPAETENTNLMMIIPALIALLGAVLVLIFRRREEEEDN